MNLEIVGRTTFAIKSMKVHLQIKIRYKNVREGIFETNFALKSESAFSEQLFMF